MDISIGEHSQEVTFLNVSCERQVHILLQVLPVDAHDYGGETERQNVEERLRQTEEPSLDETHGVEGMVVLSGAGLGG